MLGITGIMFDGNIRICKDFVSAREVYVETNLSNPLSLCSQIDPYFVTVL